MLRLNELMESQEQSLLSLSLGFFTVLLWLSPLVINSFASNRTVDLYPTQRMPLIDCCIDGHTAAAAALLFLASGQSAYCCLSHLHLIAKIFSRLANFYGNPKVNDNRSSIHTQIPVPRQSRQPGQASPVQLMSYGVARRTAAEQAAYTPRWGWLKFLLLDW